MEVFLFFLILGGPVLHQYFIYKLGDLPEFKKLYTEIINKQNLPPDSFVPFNYNTFAERVSDRLREAIEARGENMSLYLFQQITDEVERIYKLYSFPQTEELPLYHFWIPSWKPIRLPRELKQLRELQQRFDCLPDDLKVLEDLCVKLVLLLYETIPAEARYSTAIAPFKTPLLGLVSLSQIANIFQTFWADSLTKRNILSNLRERYKQNADRASQNLLPVRDFERGERIHLAEYKDAFMGVSQYLSGLPFQNIFLEQVNYFFPDQVRSEHQLIVAPSGHGKTQLLEAQILQDLQTDAALVVLDSKPDMIRRLSKLEILQDRLIYVDPRDTPALNLFDVGQHSEEVANRITGELAYFFRALLGTELTSTMGVVLRPIIQLMTHIPGANLNTFLDALDDPLKFSDKFPKLSPTAARFLQQDFRKIAGRETVAAVKRRIYDIALQSPTFEKMFNAPTNALNLPKAINEGKVVLVSTERNFLHDLSPVFGKYILSQVVSAALQRSSIPESQRHPVYLYVDEAGPYTDEEKTEEIFSTLRSYGVGVIMAFQHFDQLSPRLQTTVKTNTAIKLIGGDDNASSRIFAPDMRTTPEFIFNQTKSADQTSFACYVKGRTAQAISLSVQFGRLDDEDTISDQEYENFRNENRLRLSAPYVQQPTPVLYAAEESEDKPSDTY